MGSVNLKELLEQGETRRSRRQDEGPRRARVPARCRQGQGPPHDGGDRHQRDPPGPRPRRAAARGAAGRLLRLSAPDSARHGLRPAGLGHQHASRRVVAPHLGVERLDGGTVFRAMRRRAGPRRCRTFARSPRVDDRIDRDLDERLAGAGRPGRRRSLESRLAGWTRCRNDGLPSASAVWIVLRRGERAPPGGRSATGTRPTQAHRRQPRPRGVRAAALPAVLRHRPRRPVRSTTWSIDTSTARPTSWSSSSRRRRASDRATPRRSRAQRACWYP